MTLFRRKDAMNNQITSRGTILATILIGVAFLLVPILIIILDPLIVIVNYYLRLANGTILYNLLQYEIPGARMSVYVFNITNIDEFLSGEHYKLKVEEVGPFVFQEYRWYEDVEMMEDGKYMGMTPKSRSEFVPEASIAHPKDIHLTLPNLPFLCGVSVLSNYPSFVQYTFNIMSAQMGAKAIINIDVHSYLWGYHNPLIVLLNSLAPGIVYFKNLGLMERFYENGTDYRIVVGATNQERFKIKSIKKSVHIHTETINDVDESEITFEEDTYEGGAYPPMLTPDFSLNLYRLGICIPWNMKYIESRFMDYGGEAYVYSFSNKTFIDSVNPITLKTYPDGLRDISDCFYGLPYVVSKGHFLDVDPIVLERLDGMKPDKKVHVNEMIIDRKVGVTYDSKVSMQLNLMLDDLSSNKGLRLMSNSVIPVIHIKQDQPKMIEWSMSKFVMVYQTAPYIVLCVELMSVLIGLAFLGHAVRLAYINRISKKNGMVFQTAVNNKLINAELPLIRQ